MRKIYFALLAITFAACAELSTIMETYDIDVPLTEYEVSGGLKEALRVGTDSAATRLGALNGYYGDELVKIMLPEEASIIVDNISKIPGGNKLVEDVVIRINRAAEDAAKEAGPVFWRAIKNMTITDAFNILNGGEKAATDYLHKHTYNELFKLYNPKIQTSLDKEIVAGISTNESWESLTGRWNTIAESPIGQFADLKAVKTDLNAYLTEKALDGLFVKIAQQEKLIREDPVARVNDILKRVFGS
ncbi:MAG: DUF4197 domain-containing protein [Marinilabiliaceae bacterium]|nr:DUF4197 domain-containing protein [Marinilabiliaceae bacterium]